MNPLWRLAEKLSPEDARLHYNFFLLVLAIFSFMGAVKVLDYFEAGVLTRIVVDLLVLALVVWRFYAFVKLLLYNK